MLTLADSRHIGGITVYRDVVVEADGRRRFTSVFYPVPRAPRLARDPHGEPELNFLWYRASLDGAAPASPGAGGVLTLSIELALTAEEQAHLIEQLARTLPADSPAAIELRPLPVVEGHVAISLAGETADPEAPAAGDLTLHIAGSGPARLSGSQRATFLIELSPEGAALLWQALRGGQDILHARYELRFEHRLDSVKLRLWCDVGEAWGEAARLGTGGATAAPQLAARLRERQLAGYEILASTPLTKEHQARLERLAADLLTAALASGLREAGSPGAGAPPPPALALALNHTFSESYLGLQEETFAAILRPSLTAAQLESHVRCIDLDQTAFRVLEVQVICTAEFAPGLVAAVHVRLEYDETGPAGRVHRSAEFLFREGNTSGSFRIDLAAPDKSSYRYEALVYYDGHPEPARLSFPPTEASILVLDLEGLGVRRVQVMLGDVPLELVRTVVVEMEIPGRDLGQTLFLDAATPAATWQAVVRESPLPSYRYRPTWLLADGRRIGGSWQEATAARLFIAAPTELGPAGQVLVVAAGDFSELAQAVVSLRSAGEETTFVFTAPGQSQTYWPRLGHSSDGERLRYQARITLSYRDGVVRQLDWTDEDRPVFVVRDLLRFEVRVVPRLLNLGGALAMALLTLEYSDPAGGTGQRQTLSLTLTQSDEERVWRFHAAAPSRPRYRYQLTLIPKSGPPRSLAWQEGDSEVLVLHPAAER